MQLRTEPGTGLVASKNLDRGIFTYLEIPYSRAQPLELDRLELVHGLEGFDLARSQGRLCSLLVLQELVALESRGGGDVPGHSNFGLAVIAQEPKPSPEARL